MTDNHNYNTPTKGTPDWDVPINSNFNRIDTDVEVRDTDARKDNYIPKDGAKYFSTDTGVIYIGDGSSWNQVGDIGGANSVQTEEEVEDIVDGLLVGGPNITLTYDDGANELTIEGSSSSDTHVEVAKDASTILSSPDVLNFTDSGDITITATDAGSGQVDVDFDVSIPAKYTDEEAQDAVGTILDTSLSYDDATPSIGMNVVLSGQTTLSSGVGQVDTGVSATDATFMLSLGVDDPGADCKLAGRLFWDDSDGSYWIEINEVETSVGNPTVNYDIVRVR